MAGGLGTVGAAERRSDVLRMWLPPGRARPLCVVGPDCTDSAVRAPFRGARCMSHSGADALSG